MRYLIFSLASLVFVEFGLSCIPTQQVDPYPCKRCAKLYDSTCTGIVGYSGCLPAADVPVTYSVSTTPISSLTDLGSNVCWNDLRCPAGSTREYTIPDGGGITEGNGYNDQTVAYCPEEGSGAGEWAFWYLDESIPVASMRCTA